MRTTRFLVHGLSPTEILFVADAMTGQDAVNSAKAFNDKLQITGAILTKMDGDSRGGAALSIRQITGQPIKFLGTGEKPDAFEAFHPDRIVSRILGMGDIATLLERADETVGVIGGRLRYHGGHRISEWKFEVLLRCYRTWRPKRRARDKVHVGSGDSSNWRRLVTHCKTGLSPVC